ncbi:MAG: FHA domain-containing protein [Lachnospiraceae bacterium]|nr:FHA domain-containing protein [Lachnospiraceae bacterium]
MPVNNAFVGRVEGIRGIYAGAVIDMQPDEIITIGSSTYEANIVLPLPEVSRTHCTIRYDVRLEQYIVEDISSNGTFLGDGTRLLKDEQTILPRGTILYISDIENAFKLI